MKKITTKLLISLIFLLLYSNGFSSEKSNLYGNWKGISGAPIKIHLKKDMRYVYQYKMLTFSGKWSNIGNDITFNYSVLGRQRKKKVSFLLKKGFLTLHSNDHSNVVLKKTR